MQWTKGYTMQNLNYATLSNDKHSIQVKTWIENGMHMEQTTVDGVVRSFTVVGPVDESDD